MKYLLLFLSMLVLSGCTITIVNLAPPAPDDGLLQTVLERYASQRSVSE